MIQLKKKLAALLREIADNIDAGNSEVSDEQAIKIMSVVAHRPLSKEQACSYLNMSRSKFDELIRQGKLPKGIKRRGFSEKVWFEDELVVKNDSPD